MKINDILRETASSGATSAGGIASVSGSIGGTQRRNPNGTAVNALDQDTGFFGDNPKKKKRKKKS